ncbi:MAG: hypothetical protein ACRELX_09080 [Longimicrobiales bacterium]
MTATIGTDLETTTDREPIVALVHALCDFAAAWPPHERTRERLVWAAVDHGRDLRAAGSSESAIFDDYERLRDHLWRGIRENLHGAGIASGVILRIDSAISLAVAAALRGYYEDVIARSGEWPVAVERLLWDWRIRIPVPEEG